ncbi:MAG TPA: hypothetical protein VFU47_03675, partial [Armatimonadota bacterium]|nr:hypothetical protein [Armatimonadota bacterium]
MKRLPYRALLLLLLLAALLPRAGARAQGVLPLTEDFEQLSSGMPAGWSDDSFGEVVLQAGVDTRRPREGKSAWRLSIPAWDAGAGQVKRGGIPLRAGAGYACEVWLRGEGLSVPVTVALRKQTAPQTVYMARQFAVGPEWRRCVLEGRAAEDDPNAALLISVGGSGSVSVDALRLVEGELPVEPAPPPPPAVKGNRIYNSSFELGMDGWTVPEEVALLTEDCPDGQRFARWLPGQFPLEARPFAARPNEPYTVSAWLRSQRPGARAQLSLVEVGNEARVGETFSLTPEWKRYSFIATLPCRRFARYFLAVSPADEPHGIDV